LVSRAIDSWRELQEIAGSTARTFALELHSGSPFDSPDTARELIDRAPASRFAFDPSHLVGQGIDLHQVGWILAQSAHVHLRDAASGQVQLPMGSGSVDFGWILDQLRSRGYDGYVAVEYLDTDEFDASASARRLAELIAPYLQS
jgi:sugar phosphate isomerase/epimerase